MTVGKVQIHISDVPHQMAAFEIRRDFFLSEN